MKQFKVSLQKKKKTENKDLFKQKYVKPLESTEFCKNFPLPNKKPFFYLKKKRI